MATVTFKVHACKNQGGQLATLFFDDQGVESSVPVDSKKEALSAIEFLLRQDAISLEDYEQVKYEISKSSLLDTDEEDASEEQVVNVPIKTLDRLWGVVIPIYYIFRTEPRTFLYFLGMVKKN